MPRPRRDRAYVALGWVLASIDDVETLIALVREHEAPDADVTLHFFGGQLDQADDLRQLTDGELGVLMVKSPSIDVVLSATGAYANGDPALARDVRDLWAKPRQTWRLPSRRLAGIHSAVMAGLLVFYGLMIVGALTPVFVLLTRPADTASVVTYFIVSAMSLLAFVYFSRMAYRNGVSGSHAVLVPLSADELRKNQLNQKFPRWSLIVAIIAVIVAVAGIVVGAVVTP